MPINPMNVQHCAIKCLLDRHSPLTRPSQKPENTFQPAPAPSSAPRRARVASMGQDARAPLQPITKRPSHRPWSAVRLRRQLRHSPDPCRRCCRSHKTRSNAGFRSSVPAKASSRDLVFLNLGCKYPRYEICAPSTGPAASVTAPLVSRGAYCRSAPMWQEHARALRSAGMDPSRS
jgi:hypothetical protein